MRLNKTITILIFLLGMAGATYAQQTPENSGMPDPRVKPGAQFTEEFPDLPQTLAEVGSAMQVKLPSNYNPARKYPLFLWLNAVKGVVGVRTDLVDPEKFICIGLPLYHDPKGKRTKGINPLYIEPCDADYTWQAFSKMLLRLEELVPNIEKGTGIAAGFSNGAHAFSIFLADKKIAPKLLEYFNAFVFWEGGAHLNTTAYMQGSSLLAVMGEKSMGNVNDKRWAFPNPAGPGGLNFSQWEKNMENGKINFAAIVMKDVGHAMPAEYVPNIKEWTDNIENRNAFRRIISPVKWQSATLNSVALAQGTNRLEQLSAFFNAQDFVKEADSTKLILIYLFTSKASKDPSQNAFKLCQAVEQTIFSYPQAVGTLPVSRYFVCVRVDVAGVELAQNILINRNTVPIIVLLNSDRNVHGAFSGSKMSDAVVSEKMKELLSEDDKAALAEKQLEIKSLVTEILTTKTKIANAEKNIEMLRKTKTAANKQKITELEQTNMQFYADIEEMNNKLVE